MCLYDFIRISWKQYGINVVCVGLSNSCFAAWTYMRICCRILTHELWDIAWSRRPSVCDTMPSTPTWFYASSAGSGRTSRGRTRWWRRETYEDSGNCFLSKRSLLCVFSCTPPSKRMAQNLDLCHLLCIRTHVKTHLRHLPQNYLTTDKGSTAQGEKNLKNLVIQKRIFRWHLRHLLWLAWFPSKKYWIDGASANLWAIPLTCVCCLRQETV